MSEKLAWIEKEKRQPDDQCNLMLRNSEIVHGTYIKSKDHAIAVITALLQHYNITADELPCLWSKTKTARDCEEYIASWRDPILTKILTYNKEDCEWFDDIHNEYNQPDYIMPIPPLPKGGEE